MSVDPWAGLHVAGLCVGVGNYRYLDKLDNAVRDAQEVNKRLNCVPNCYSALLENPAWPRDLLRKIIQCLQEPGLREKPPDLFLFYYAGHAIQLNSKVYLVPSWAKLDNRNMYDVDCLTLDKLLETLRDTLDLPVRHKMHKPRSIAFLVVLDCCRNSIDDALACEPAPQSMPNNTTILFSCSRTKRADDGPSGGHSPFAQALLHAKHGFFAKGATLQEAFSHIGAGALDSQACGQKPIIFVPAGAIPPQFRIWPSPDTQTNPCGGAGDSTLCNSSDSTGSSTSSATGPSVIGRAEGEKSADNPQEGTVSKKQRIVADDATPGMRLGKTSMRSHDAGEGSSSGAKRQKLDQAVAKQSELPLQVSSEGVTSSIGRIDKRLHDGEGGSLADSKAGDDVAAKKQRLQEPHAGGGGGGRGDGQGSGGGFAASLDSTQQAFPYDVFISHAWDKDDEGRDYRDNHERTKRLNAGLQGLGMKTWFHDEKMQGDILDCMTRGIKGSAVVLICVTRRYAEQVRGEADSNCKLEFNYAYGKRTSVFMLPVVMEKSMTRKSEWGDRLFAVLGFHFYHKLTSDADDEFDKGVSEIAAAVRRKIHENLLRDLQQATSSIVQGAMCSREPSPTPSDQSDMSTVPQSPSSQSEVMGIHVESAVSEFRDDMKKFMQDFLHKRRLSELLLVAFMRDKVAPSCDAEIAENLATWQGKCEDPAANLVISFNKIMLSLKPSILKEQLSYEFSDGNKKNHTSVFVIDWMVQHSPWALNKSRKALWIDEVVKDFDPNNADSAEDFLERAEKFLQEAVKGEKWGIKILRKVIETNSYVAFFRMEALAALLLREYCSQQKILHALQQKQHDAQKTVHNPQCTLPLSIGLMVSSSNWHLSFTKGEVHSACMSEIAWQLQRIACLPTKTLENNEHSLSELEAVEWEPIYNLNAGRPHRGQNFFSSPPSHTFTAMNDLEELDELNDVAGVKSASEETEAEDAPESDDEVWWQYISLTISDPLGNDFSEEYCIDSDIPLMLKIRRQCGTDFDRVVWCKRDKRGQDDTVIEYELDDRDTPMSLGMDSRNFEYCEVYWKYEQMCAQSTDASDEERDGYWLNGTDASDEESDGNWLDGLGSPRAPLAQTTVAKPAEAPQAQANAEPAWQAHDLGVDEDEVY